MRTRFITFSILFFVFTFSLSGQPLPCENTGSEFFSGLRGSWQVTAKDRTSPGNYEENTATSNIQWGIKGCSIQEVYEGTFKGHGYAVMYNSYLNDSLSVIRTFYDSEHGNMMRFDGQIEGDTLKAMWFRDESQRMQVRNLLIRKGDNQFENITHLSTDHGETWALTHHWVYRREK